MTTAATISDTRGVNWNRSKRKWEARLQHGGKRHHLGYFAEERDAAAAYQAAREAAAEGRLDEHLAARREAAATERASGYSIPRSQYWADFFTSSRIPAWHRL